MQARREMARTKKEQEALARRLRVLSDRRAEWILKALGVWNPNEPWNPSFCYDGNGPRPDSVLLTWRDALAVVKRLRKLERDARGTR